MKPCEEIIELMDKFSSSWAENLNYKMMDDIELILCAQINHDLSILEKHGQNGRNVWDICEEIKKQL